MNTSDSDIMQYEDLVGDVALADPKEWLGTRKRLTVEEICRKFNIIIRKTGRNRRFLDAVLNRQVFIDNEMLTYMGFRGSFARKMRALRKILKTDTIKSISYVSIRKMKCIAMDLDNFYRLLELAQSNAEYILVIFDAIIEKYSVYKKLFANPDFKCTNNNRTIPMLNTEEIIAARQNTANMMDMLRAMS